MKNGVDRTARLERRIERLEELVWKHGDGNKPGEQIGENPNLPPERLETLLRKHDKQLSLADKAPRSGAKKASTKADPPSSLQTRRTVSRKKRQKKKVLRRRAARVLPPKEPPNKAASHQQAQKESSKAASKTPTKAGPLSTGRIKLAVRFKRSKKKKSPRRRTNAKGAASVMPAKKSAEPQSEPQEVLNSLPDKTVAVGEHAQKQPVLFHERPDNLHKTESEADETPTLVVSPQQTEEQMVDSFVQEDEVHAEDPITADEPTEQQAVHVHEHPDHLLKAESQVGVTVTSAVSAQEMMVLSNPLEQTLESDGEAVGGIADDIPANEEEWARGGKWESGAGWRTGGAAVGNPQCRKKVLVVDDDATMRMLLRMGLRSRGYDCLTAEHGVAAQAALQTYCPDLILLDLLMPVMDGLTFLQWLRQTARDSTPVLVFSNVNTPSVTQEALASGANSFACKPLHLNELVEVINQLVPS